MLVVAQSLAVLLLLRLLTCHSCLQSDAPLVLSPYPGSQLVDGRPHSQQLGLRDSMRSPISPMSRGSATICALRSGSRLILPGRWRGLRFPVAARATSAPCATP